MCKMTRTSSGKKPVLFAQSVNIGDESPMDRYMFFILTPEGEVLVYRKPRGNENFITSYLRKIVSVTKKDGRSMYDKMFYNNECVYKQEKIKGHVDLRLTLKYVGCSYDFVCPAEDKFEREPFTGDWYVYGIPEIHFFEVYTYRKNKGWVTIKSLENMKVELDPKLINDIMKWDEVEETPSGAAATLLKRVVQQIEQQKEEDRARVEDIVESVQC